MGTGASSAITRATEEDLQMFMSTLPNIQKDKLQAALHDLEERQPTVKPQVEEQTAEFTAVQQDSAMEHTVVQQTDVVTVFDKSAAGLDAQKSFPKSVLVRGAELIQPELMGLYVKSSIAPGKEHSHRPIYQSAVGAYYLHYNIADGYNGTWIIGDTCTGRDGKMMSDLDDAPCPTAVSEWLVKWEGGDVVKALYSRGS